MIIAGIALVGIVSTISLVGHFTKNIPIKEENISSTENEQLEKEESTKNYKVKSEYIEGEKPLYVDNILVVNKDYHLPSNYAPGESQEARDAILKMQEDAKKEGVYFYVRSAYRSYDVQEELYNGYVARDGQEVADTYSAKPGTSEHQTGLAFDFTHKTNGESVSNAFDNTPEATWLYENAYKYGFILRYPLGKEHITGYMYESWHYRYIGTEHSQYFKMNDLTLEEYLGLYPVSNE